MPRTQIVSLSPLRFWIFDTPILQLFYLLRGMQIRRYLPIAVWVICINSCFCVSFLASSEKAEAAQPTKDEIQTEVKNSLKETTVVIMPAHHFKLKYPKNWQEQEPKEGTIVCRFKTLNGLVSARIAIEPLPASFNLDTYTSATADQVKKVMSAQRMPITVVSESTTEFGGTAAHQTIYTYPVDGTPMTAKVEQIITIKNGKGYVFNYTAADANLYDDFLGVITEIVKSVEWI